MTDADDLMYAVFPNICAEQCGLSDGCVPVFYKNHAEKQENMLIVTYRVSFFCRRTADGTACCPLRRKRLFSHIYENVLICAENIRSALMRSAVRLLRGRFRTDLADGGHARS